MRLYIYRKSKVDLLIGEVDMITKIKIEWLRSKILLTDKVRSKLKAQYRYVKTQSVYLCTNGSFYKSELSPFLLEIPNDSYSNKSSSRHHLNKQ